MTVQISRIIVAAIAGFWLVSAHAQDATVSELKSKGATVLSANELKAFLPGTTLRYENPKNSTQLKLEPDGSLSGSAQKRIGGSSTATFAGQWNVTEKGRWCGVFQHAQGGETKYCRDILKLGDKYYYAGGNPGNDQRPANEMSVSK